MLGIYLLFVIIVLFLWIRKIKIKKDVILFERYKTSTPSLPIIGHAFMFLTTNTEDIMKLVIKLGEESYQHGGLITLWLGKLIVGVADPDIANAILMSSSSKDDIANPLQLLIGNGSLSAPVSIWRPRRKIIAPNFRTTNLVQFVKTFDEQSTVMNKCLSEVGAETFSISKYFTRYSLDAVCENTIGVKLQSQVNPRNEFLAALEEVFDLTAMRIVRPWMHSDTIYKLLPVYKKYARSRDTVRNFVTKVIETKKLTTKELIEENGLKSFLTYFIQAAENNRGFGDLEILEELVVIVVGATDTSAVGASFTALLLSRHPRVQDKCYQELFEVFGESDRAVTHLDLLRLKYLEAVIKETMRLYPPAPIITRKMEKDFNISTGDTVPKGCCVIISMYAIHRNPLYWGADADQFRPERFLDEEVKHPAAFMPFSVGPRNCIGNKYAMLSMTTVLANVLRRYRLLEALPRCEHAHIRLKNDIMLRDVDNFPVRIQARHN